MELWDGYYSGGTLANVDLVRDEYIPKGIYHMVCEVLVRHTDGEYLLTRRALTKPSNPGRYEATIGGSALKGEDAVTCAKRELFEETGILSDSFEKIGRFVSDDTIYFNFLCVTECEKDSIKLQEGETIEYKWVSEDEFISFVNSNEMIETQRKHYMKYLSEKGYIDIKNS